MLRSTLLAFFCVTLFSGSIFAQSNLPDIDTTKLINPADLIIAYEETSQIMREVSNKLIVDYKTTEIEQAYNAIENKIDNYYRIGGQDMDKARLSRIDDLIIIFERLRDQVQGWQLSLTDYSKDLSNFKIEIIKSKMRLSIDIRELSDRGEAYYNERFVPIFDQADSLDTVIDERLEKILELEYLISNDYVRLLNRIDELKAFRKDYWRRITRREEFNWSDIRADSLSFDVSAAKSEDTIWRISDFFRDNTSNNLVLFLVVVGFYLLLRRMERIDKREENEENRHPRIYSYPVAQALLFGGMLFPVIYPPTTTLMYDFALVFTYIPFLWILYKVLEWNMFRRYLLFFGVFLVMKIIYLIFPFSVLTSLIVGVAGVVFFITLIGKTIRSQLVIHFKLIFIFNWLLRLTLVIGLLLIVLKRFSLGSIFINGAGETIAIGLVLIYVANWLEEVLEFVKKQPYIKRLGADKAELNDYFSTLRNRIYILLFLLFVIAFLRDFNLLGAVKDSVYEFFTSERKLGELVFTYGGIALFVLTIYLTTKLSASVKFLTDGRSYYKSVKKTANLGVMLRFMLITGGFVLALLVSGIPIDRITVILGALSVGIGFGLQNIVNNLISGLVLIFERPIQSGDLVELQQYMGVVKDIGIRASVIRTYDGAEVIVPNGNLISQEVINWTLSNQHRRIEILVGVAYGSNTEEVAEILRAPILAHEKALKLPQPLVLFNGFGDSSLDFRLLFWTSDIDNWLRTKSEVTHEIYKALNEKGVEIPFPQRDLHLRSWDEEAILPSGSEPKKKAAPKPKKKTEDSDKTDSAK